MNFAMNVIAKSAFILICATVISTLLRRSSASMRHAVWILALVSALLLPCVALIVPQFEWSLLPRASTSVTFVPLGEVAASVAIAERGLKPATTYAETFLPRLGYFWLAGALALLARFGFATLAVERMANAAVPAANESWQAMIRDLTVALEVRRPVRLLFSESRLSPMTWGVLRHTILLPSSAADWSEERRRLVLAHELAHVKRNDGLIQIVVQVICCMYWFNPIVWYAAHRVRIERERACDDHVLNLGTVAAEYADHLIQIVRSLRSQRTFSFPAVSMAQASQLETRLVSILDSRVRRRTFSRASTGLLFALTTVFTVSIATLGVTAAVQLPPVFVSAIQPTTKPAVSPQRTRIGNAGAATNTAVVPPKVLESSPPMYTPEAVAANVEGIVTLEGSVDIQGKVSALRVLKGLGYGLDPLAVKAVSRWKFSPALRDGQPVETITQIEVDFRIPRRRPEMRINTRISVGADDARAENPPQAALQVPAEDDAPPVRIGAGVTPPIVIFRVEPQYTPEARDAKYQGTVVVEATIHQDGRLTVNRVVRELEYGLTEKAIEALEEWKFRPGTRDGKAVAVALNIEVNFNLQ